MATNREMHSKTAHTLCHIAVNKYKNILLYTTPLVCYKQVHHVRIKSRCQNKLLETLVLSETVDI